MRSIVEMEYIQASPFSREQCDCVPMLAVCFDEFVEFRKRYGERFPFAEESFIARTADAVAGHTGVMPVQVCAGEGKVLKLGGIASVAVHPDFRRRGIAADLCNMAAEWADNSGYDMLPLYTGLNRVYESCGWQNYRMQSVTLINRSPVERKGRSGAELTAEEKEIIISCYEEMPEFPGKVIRTKDTYFHSWERMFNETFFTWYVGDDGYALEYAGFVAEGTSASLCSGMKQAFLSPEDALVEKLLACGWCIEKHNDNAPACWNGENVMIRPCAGKELPSNIFFSLADKF